MNALTAAALLAFALAATVAPWRRHGWTAPHRAIALELIAFAVAATGAVLLGDFARPPRWLRPWREIALLGAAYWYALQGGSAVVRLVLDLVPVAERPPRGGIPIQEAELSRGRIIGVLERALALTLVLLGQFGALGLIVAAKALARFRALENRDFAEYFLIGTLTSLLHALVVGALVRLIV